MRVASIGGGPAGLYFSLLLKKASPDVEVDVYERNRADDTFGWGVVFSDETLGNFERADPESYAEITRRFAYWTDIETYVGDAMVRSTGHGFCGFARRDLLAILQARCRALGVRLHFEREVTDVDALAGEVDLLLGADGINSRVRERFADAFRPSLDWRRCRFSWLGTTKPLEAFTFIFTQGEHGLFQVHAYPFAPDRSTFIVECHEDTWRRAGLDGASEADTIAYCEALFADHLDGHRLLANRSIWRSFPTVRNERWHHDHVVLLGDAAHTAHFSIGSGTKLAMEDAIALHDACVEHGLGDVPRVLEAYHEARWLDCLKTQKAAQTSLEWFENSRRYVNQHPLQFTFNLMTRSKRITWDNLSVRDPGLMERVRGWWWDHVAGAARASDGSAPPPMFAPFRLRGMQLENRVVVSPMCQYSATDGVVNDWHLVHLGARAVGGAGLVFTEMTDVSPEGRITHGCAGIYNDAQVRAWRRIVDFVHERTPARIAIQIAHAGRKASCHLPWEGDDPLRDESAWPTIAPSAIPFDEGWHVPRAMRRTDMDRVREDFVQAARRAERAGFDMLELHMAHGYLLSSFLSPASNRRDDEYGGSLENRVRWPLEVFDAVRAAWPRDKPMAVRLSATDWLDDEPGAGVTIDETVEIARALADRGCDLIDVSSAGNTPRSRPVYGRMYQVPFAERIRHEVGVPVMAVGAILGPDHANTILAAGRADLCAMARPHLVNPSITRVAAVAYGHHDQWWPDQYLPAKPAPRES